ncbi:MAG: hypothetical protein AB7W16_04870 [Candidatus Obscuribacterales bacterium]
MSEVTDIPVSDMAALIRTDFSSPEKWYRLRELVCAPVLEYGRAFYAYVDFVDDPTFANFTKEQIMKSIPANYLFSFFIVADCLSLSQPGYPLLFVDLLEIPGRELRVSATAVQGVENNLSISNMDFEEFVENVDESGVFRGFRVSE